MANTTFISKVTTIARAWLQDVNDAVYKANSSITGVTSSIYRTLLVKLSDTVNAKDLGITFDGVTDDTAAWQAAMLVLNGKTLYLPDGALTSIVTGKVTLPRSIKILGPSRRGIGNPGAMVGGAGIKANFAGPVFEYAPGVLTSADIVLDGFTIRGNQGTYGAGNGINITNCSDTTLRNMVISNFGTNNISTSGGNYTTLESVYSASAGNANFYIDSDHCKIKNCSSDGGVYSVFSTSTGGSDLSIDGGSWFEGATNTGLSLAGQRTTLEQTTVNQTAGGKGLVVGAVRFRLGAGVKILGEGTAASTTGIDLQDKIEYTLLGPLCSGFVTAAKTTAGAGQIIGGHLEGGTTGLDVTASGTFITKVIGTYISGATNSLLHNAGNNAQYIGCTFDDGAGTPKPPTITAGSPQFIDTSTLVEKAGSGAGDYSTSNAAYVDVDATNLSYTVTIPKSWNLHVIVHCVAQLSGAGVMTFGILDGSIIEEKPFDIVAATAAIRAPYFLQKIITGDGASHTVKLQWKVSANTATLTNGTAANAPRMVFLLTPTK